ncbi:acyltransferase family protein [Cerasicoccus frondis]|uniref:acyltransferase family protein n=1 Tax=Cerasicoccus frondis TaxID=490090 RepID=UPI002852C72F|nr:acyltransferase [Cerasicoccus frondis]
MKHLPKIDGLRAIAVVGVLVSHYLPKDHGIQLLPWGILGVQLFFVISGFLITGILLDARDKASDSTVLKAFYARRFLRIIPPYYLLLGLYLLAGLKFEPGTLTASFLYYLNIFQAVNPGSYLYLGHFWTLCIEEQFYLIWPWVIIFLPRSKLVGFTILAIIFAPISRMLLDLTGFSYVAVRNLPTSALDSLAGGALLALMHHGHAPRLFAWWRRNYGWVMLAGIFLYAWTRFLPNYSPEHLWVGLLGTSLSGMAAVHYATLNYNTFADRVLNNSFLRYIGKISYGIYLYQFLTLYPLYKIISMLGHPPLLSNVYIFAIVWTVLTVITASLSWYCFEKPLLSLKRRFNYNPHSTR